MALNKTQILAIAVTALFATHSAWADKPDFAGSNKESKSHIKKEKTSKSKHDKSSEKQHSKKAHNHDKNSKSSQGNYDNRLRDQREYRRDKSGNVSINIHFDDKQRRYIRDYYGAQFRQGNCPPGLAKKHNGCMPPGQAKKWRKGYPLDPSIIYYDLEPAVLVHIGRPPAGYKYVRVASSILMIAIGTGLVVDAVADLNAM